MSICKSVQCVSGKYQLIKSTIPKPAAGQVLIKTAYSTINPHDRLQYQFKKVEGHILGSEGCGEIVDVGEGIDKSLIGYHVSFWENGWSTYCARDSDQIMHLNKSIDLKVAANSYINPLTSCGFLYVVQNQYKSGGVILTAGSSNLARMFTKFAEAHHLKVINIVRSEKAKALLQKDNVAIFNNELQQMEELERMIKEVQPKVVLDALSGPVAGQIFEKMQPESTFLSIGNLTNLPLTLQINDLRWNNKKVGSFMVNRWLASLPFQTRIQQFKTVERDLMSKEPFFATPIAKEVTLEQWEDVLLSSQNDANEGKYLMRID